MLESKAHLARIWWNIPFPEVKYFTIIGNRNNDSVTDFLQLLLEIVNIKVDY